MNPKRAWRPRWARVHGFGDAHHRDVSESLSLEEAQYGLEQFRPRQPGVSSARALHGFSGWYTLDLIHRRLPA